MTPVELDELLQGDVAASVLAALHRDLALRSRNGLSRPAWVESTDVVCEAAVTT